MVVMDTTIDTLKSIIQQRGLRASYHRIKVLEYLYIVRGHPTVDDIYLSLSREIPSLSRATIYNTLNAFVNCRLVHEISIDGIEKRYDASLENHGHFLCKQCGTIFNFHIDIDPIQVEEISQFEIHDKNVYFNGICPDCLNLNLLKGENHD